MMIEDTSITKNQINYPSRPENQRIALVLQGGGAMGAYQAGVYQALDEHGFCPDWIAGTSIGALNGAIIAGNRPEDRVTALREFWDTLAQGIDSGIYGFLPDQGRQVFSLGNAMSIVANGLPGFFSPRPDLITALFTGQSAETASYYTTEPLRKLVERLIDFKCLESNKIRLSVGAVNVTSGELTYFDSSNETLAAEHILASGALPPGFPAVRINDEFYWDGALYSNTPLEVVLEDNPRVDTLCFAVSLFPATGRVPQTISEVDARQKDITFGSRLNRHINAYERLHNLRRKINLLYQHLPKKLQDDPEIRELSYWGCHTTMQIVKLAYPGMSWELASKDIDFSRVTINERWRMGYDATLAMLNQAPWLQPHPVDQGVVVHTPNSNEKESLEIL